MIPLLRLITMFCDFLSLLGAFSLAYFVRVNWIFSSDLPFPSYFSVALASAVVWIFSLMLYRGYHTSFRITRPQQLIKIGIAGITATGFFGLLFYFTEKAVFSRLLLLYIFVFGVVSVTTVHLILRWVEKKLIQHGYGITPLLIIGTNRGVKAFIEDLKHYHSSFVPVAILDGYGTSAKEVAGVPVLGKLNLLEESVETYSIRAVVQGDNLEQVLNILHFCQKKGIQYSLLPYILGMYQDPVKITSMEKPLISPAWSGEKSLFSRILG